MSFFLLSGYALLIWRWILFHSNKSCSSFSCWCSSRDNVLALLICWQMIILCFRLHWQHCLLVATVLVLI